MIELNTVALRNALGVVRTTVPSRTPKEVLRCVRFTPWPDALELMATDLEYRVTCRTRATTNGCGPFLVEAERLSRLVDRITAETLVFREHGTEILVSTPSGDEFRFSGHAATNFPGPSDHQYQPICSIRPDALLRCLRLVSQYIGECHMSYSLAAIHMEYDGSHLRFAGTDGRAIVVLREVVEPDGTEPWSCLLGREVISRLSRLEGEIAKISSTDNHLRIECGNATVEARMVEGRYPRYQDIVKRHTGNLRSTVKAASLAEAFRKADLFREEDHNFHQLTVSGGMLTISNTLPNGACRVSCEWHSEHEIDAALDLRLVTPFLQGTGDDETLVVRHQPEDNWFCFELRDGAATLVAGGARREKRVNAKKETANAS